MMLRQTSDADGRHVTTKKLMLADTEVSILGIGPASPLHVIQVQSLETRGQASDATQAFGSAVTTSMVRSGAKRSFIMIGRVPDIFSRCLTQDYSEWQGSCGTLQAEPEYSCCIYDAAVGQRT